MTNTVTGQPATGDQGAGSQAQDKAKEVASQAQDKAKEAAGQARGRVSDEVDRRSTQVGERVGGATSDARSVADELRKQGKDAPAKYVEQAADRAERLGGYLQDSDGDRILHDVEDYARRNPWVVAAGGLVLGFAASRMLKASSSERYRSTQALPRGNAYSGGDFAGTGATGTRPSQFEPHV
jgi:ElaB/YqjD/DUF883 family membrane-anchored ribosome-binding protein